MDDLVRVELLSDHRVVGHGQRVDQHVVRHVRVLVRAWGVHIPRVALSKRPCNEYTRTTVLRD